MRAALLETVQTVLGGLGEPTVAAWTRMFDTLLAEMQAGARLPDRVGE